MDILDAGVKHFLKGKRPPRRETQAALESTRICVQASTNTKPKKPQRGTPGFAAGQRERILELLRQAGPHGVRREDLIFRHRWTQCGTRIFELEQEGYKIRHEARPGERLVFYVLESEPLQLTPLPSNSDWYTAKGKPRPQEEADLGPLFSPAGVRK
jgi:hypothetical protein